MDIFKLENHLKNAESVTEVAGVYWSARDAVSQLSPANHHFIAIIYENLLQAAEITGAWGLEYFEITNDKTVTFQITTLGVGTDNGSTTGNIITSYNSGSDRESLHEIARESNTSWYIPDWDLEGHKVCTDHSTLNFELLPDFVNELFKRSARFMDNYDLGHKINYELVDENCACFVNSLMKETGIPADIRHELGEFSTVDWGEEDLLPSWLFYTLEDYDKGYIGNRRSLELHVQNCYWVSRMKESNKVFYQTVAEALAVGYNGCASCLKAFNTG